VDLCFAFPEAQLTANLEKGLRIRSPLQRDKGAVDLFDTDLAEERFGSIAIGNELRVRECVADEVLGVASRANKAAPLAEGITAIAS